ncbi:MAG: DNA replication and repair protein RecF [Gemmatimonadetes bacterium]|nr:DNA replication and repair protein RecF [Gemmatimonadota bacterium]
MIKRGLENSAVRLGRIRLQNFRNFQGETLELPPGGAMISGGNGQGKTNLLEAIYYLATFRSFRGARDEQLVRFGADFFRVEGQVGELMDAAAEHHTLSAAFHRVSGEKRVTVDGREALRLSEAVGRLPAVIFTGTDVGIARGAPGLRRRFLDVALSLARPAYLAALQQFRRALTQRNECLRRGSSAAEVEAWDEMLVTWGAVIVRDRARWVRDNADAFARHYAAISGSGPARLVYVSGWKDAGPEDDVEEWRRSYGAALERTRHADRLRRWTRVGPHRDDLAIELSDRTGARGEGLDLRVYGSGGEQRTAALALRLTEAEWLRGAMGCEPLALLDDVFGELDRQRVRRVLELLGSEGRGQVILSAAQPVDWAAEARDLLQVTVEGGRLRSAARVA